MENHEPFGLLTRNCPKLDKNKSIVSAFSIFKVYWGVPKKGIDKKLSFGAAHNFNSQFLNLFGFSISVSFV